MGKYIISDEVFEMITNIDMIINSRKDKPIGIAMNKDQYEQIAQQMEIATGNRPLLVCFGIPVKIISDGMAKYIGNSIGALVIYDKVIWDVIGGDGDNQDSESEEI